MEPNAFIVYKAPLLLHVHETADISSTLTMVGTSGQLATGIMLLGFYSPGLAIPMLVIGYPSHLSAEQDQGTSQA